MKKLSYLIFFAFATLTITSCGSGDDSKTNPENNGSSSMADIGKDGLKGYWLSDEWNEAIATVGIWESENSAPVGGYSYPVYRGSRQATMFEYSTLVYLDGEGGGTIWVPVSTAEKGGGYFQKLIGDFRNTSSGELISLSYLSELQFGPTPYGVESWVKTPDKVIKGAIVYYQQGSTLQIFYGNTEMWTFNVNNGLLSGCQRLTKEN